MIADKWKMDLLIYTMHGSIVGPWRFNERPCKKIVELLLGTGQIDVNAVDHACIMSRLRDLCATALWHAAARNKADVCKILLAHKELDPQRPALIKKIDIVVDASDDAQSVAIEDYHHTPLAIACFCKNFEAVEALLADPRVEVLPRIHDKIFDLELTAIETFVLQFFNASLAFSSQLERSLFYPLNGDGADPSQVFESLLVRSSKDSVKSQRPSFISASLSLQRHLPAAIVKSEILPWIEPMVKIEDIISPEVVLTALQGETMERAKLNLATGAETLGSLQVIPILNLIKKVVYMYAADRDAYDKRLFEDSFGLELSDEAALELTIHGGFL